MTTGRFSVGRAREELRRSRAERDRRREAREPLEVAWEREQAQARQRTTDVERVAGRVAGGLVVGLLLGAWLELSLASFLALLLATMVAWAALGWLVDRFEGERPGS